NRLLLIVDDDRAVRVEAEGAPIGAPQLLLRAYDHRASRSTLAHLAVGHGLANADDDDVAHARVAAARAPEHLDALDGLSSRIVGNVENGLYLNHDLVLRYAVGARSMSRTSFQRLCLEIGRCSMISTRSPTRYSSCSSWAW